MQLFTVGDTVIFAFSILILAVILVWRGVKVVPQGHQWTVERFGRYTRTLRPGLTLIVPFIDRVGRKLSVMETDLDVPSQDIISSDNVAITADAVVFFRVDDAAKAAYEISNLNRALINLTTTNLRSVLGSMELDYMLSNREHINLKLQEAIDEATASWGVKVTRIEIRDLEMSTDLQNAMNLQMTAERQRRAAVTEANGVREAAVLKAQGDREANILRAEGEKQAAILAAEAREREAQAEAEATRVVSESISSNGKEALSYFIGREYVTALQAIGESPNSKLVLMPLEASGVTGSVAGLAELLGSIKSGN